MTRIPGDIYLEIFSRVPVRSAYICRCVCKFWLQIISNPSFVKMHLDFNTHRNNYNLIMDRTAERSSSGFTINSISYDSLSSLRESEIVEFLDYPFSEFIAFELVDSCNGLVCIRYFTRDTIVTIDFMFFNPATKEYKRISKSLRGGVSNIKAFGYDCMADDYKLIVSFEYKGYELLDVYVLGTNEWKSSQIVPYDIPDKRQAGTFVNGAFHWFGQPRDNNSSKLIVSFDISNEKIGELQLSKELVEKMYSSMIIEVLECCLCVLVMETHDCLEVWVMQDYGVEESWVQRYIICHETIMSNFDVSRMWSLKNGQILLGNYSDQLLVIYDPKHSSFRELSFSGNPRLVNAVSYVESLVSLNSGTYAGGKKMIGT